MTAREVGRETSWNLSEARTVLGRAETALASLQPERVERHYWHGVNAGRGECPDDCPVREHGGWGEVETARYPDPDHDEIRAALSALVVALSKFRRTGRPRRTP